jgi:hypothetical protein
MNESHSSIRSAHKAMSELSRFADRWLEITFKCNGWSIEPSEFPPWALSRPNKPINTSFPLLFIGNSYDPATPFKNAISMALKFENAGVIEQKSEGHCTYAATSTCTLRAIRAYLRKGSVPPPPVVVDTDALLGNWKSCEPDEWPWQQNTSITPQARSLDPEDVAIVKAWGNLQGQPKRYSFGR